MPLKANKKIILCKAEVTYGVDPVPVVGTDAMSVQNFNCQPANVRYAERNLALPYFGNRGQIPVGETMTMEFDVEIARAGAVAAKARLWDIAPRMRLFGDGNANDGAGNICAYFYQ
ncbi:MAG: hypothetical protein IPJ05_02860 [Nitrosomonas sp.]|nr:hypothetical protein [Nitrosomonas sp.]